MHLHKTGEINYQNSCQPYVVSRRNHAWTVVHESSPKRSKISPGLFFHHIANMPRVKIYMRGYETAGGRPACFITWSFAPTLASQWGDGSVVGSALSGISTRHMYLSPDLQRLFIFNFLPHEGRNEAAMTCQNNAPARWRASSTPKDPQLIHLCMPSISLE